MENKSLRVEERRIELKEKENVLSKQMAILCPQLN